MCVDISWGVAERMNWYYLIGPHSILVEGGWISGYEVAGCRQGPDDEEPEILGDRIVTVMFADGRSATWTVKEEDARKFLPSKKRSERDDTTPVAEMLKYFWKVYTEKGDS